MSDKPTRETANAMLLTAFWDITPEGEEQFRRERCKECQRNAALSATERATACAAERCDLYDPTVFVHAQTWTYMVMVSFLNLPLVDDRHVAFVNRELMRSGALVPVLLRRADGQIRQTFATHTLCAAVYAAVYSYIIALSGDVVLNVEEVTGASASAFIRAQRKAIDAQKRQWAQTMWQQQIEKTEIARRLDRDRDTIAKWTAPK